MHPTDLGERVDTTTRRAVVKTGVKLAYAVPLVAASFKLRSTGAGAVSDGESCGTPTRCGAPSFGSCLNNCFCVSSADGSQACVFGRVPAGGLVTCSSGAGCQADQVCVLNTCFGTVCADSCAGSNAADAAASEQQSLF
jgi:hypothetical protein